MKIKKLSIIIALTILIVILALAFFIFKPKISGNTVLIYTHTKAICNESNYCQDYEIECRNNEASRISPISGAAIQQPDEWKDARENKSLC